MSLSRDTLLSKIWDVIQRAGSGSINVDVSQFPNMPSDLAQAFAQAYDGYAGDATAGTLSVTTKGSVDTLARNFMDPNLSGWAAGVGIYWGQVVFGGDSAFVPSNQVTSDSDTRAIESISAGIQKFLNFAVDPPSKASEGADRLTGLLHDGTLQLVIQTTTSDSSGTLATVPIS